MFTYKFFEISELDWTFSKYQMTAKLSLLLLAYYTQK